jgi:hypothetical protein
MARIRYKTRRYRGKKYRKKNNPRLTNLRFKELIEWQIPQINLERYLRKDNIVETQVMKLLEEKGISGELMKLYLACYRDLLEIYRKFEDKTREKELEIAISRWIERGLDKKIIDVIVEELNYKSQGWFLFDTYEEYALMLDYLRLKAFADISEPITYKDFIQAYVILPIEQRFRIKVPINLETISNVFEPIAYEPNKIVRYEIRVLPSEPTNTYKNFITYQLNISYE